MTGAPHTNTDRSQTQEDDEYMELGSMWMISLCVTTSLPEREGAR